MESKKKVRVLLVDDEADFVYTLSERLKTRGMETKAVTGGREALADIAREEPDILVLDLKMPDMDGMEVLGKMRENFPGVETIILTGLGTDEARKKAEKLGAAGFLDKPFDLHKLVERINTLFTRTVRRKKETMFTYNDFAAILKHHLDRYDISLGENALGIKCFCRDDNQDRISYLLTGIGKSSGWFDLNSFGAYPAGRSLESLGPPSHHIPDVKEKPWLVLVHATHVGCDANLTLGLAERYGMRQESASCGLLAGILARHRKRTEGEVIADFRDYEMQQAEISLSPYLDEIAATDYPMATIADRLLELGHDVFDGLLREHAERALYVGGINVDCTPETPERNFFVPKIACVYDRTEKTEFDLE
jgi:CheY-like chemotaxis protein